MEHNLQILLLNLNAIVCLIIAIRTFLWRVVNKPKNLMQSFTIYFLIVSGATISIRTLTGEYLYADWAESLINIFLCMLCITQPRAIYFIGEKK